MAGSVRCLTKLNLGLLSKSVTRYVALNQMRTLFCESSLGMTAYQRTRSMFKEQFMNLEDSFKSRMKTYVDNEVSGMIFSEDLKVMLHLADNTPEDTELIINMARKFICQSADLRFSSYQFGPIFMRTLYRLQQPDIAVELFNDKAFGPFFNQLSSYQILLDLLYCNKKYTEMMQVYDSITNRNTASNVHPRNSLILVSAGCYKENTPESWKYGLTLWRTLDKRGYPVIRRVLINLSALAINQGDNHIALEMLMTAKKPHFIAIRCLKIKAFCSIGRLDDIIPFFRNALEKDDPSMRKTTFFKDTIDAVEAAIERAKLGPDAEIVKLLNLIKKDGFVQADTFDDHISEDIKLIPHVNRSNRDDLRGYRNTGSSNRQSESSDYVKPQIYRKSGLRDLI